MQREELRNELASAMRYADPKKGQPIDLFDYADAVLKRLDDLGLKIVSEAKMEEMRENVKAALALLSDFPSP